MIQTYKTGQQTALYEILDEIHAPDSATAQCYIDTLYIPKQNSYFEFVYKCRFSSTTQGPYQYPRLFAACDGLYGDTGLFGGASYVLDYEADKLLIKLNGMTNWWQNSGILPDDVNIHTVIAGWNMFYYDGTKIGNFSYSWNSGNTNVSMKINTHDTTSEAGHYNIYGFNIYEGTYGSGTKVMELVPAKRMSDNAVGMYDKISDTFYASSGVDAFVATSKSTPEYIYDNVNENNYVNDILLHKQGVLAHKYEVLDYVSCTQSQYFDTDIYAQQGISVEMTCKMTSRPGNTRLFSTHDPRDYSGQNWAFASGCWGLQFEGNTMCIKMLGNNNGISSFAMTSVNYSSVSGHKYLYDLSCNGIFNIYEPSDNSLWYTFECTAGTDTTKVSQTTIRMFGREAAEQSEWFYGDVYDVKIKNNGTTIRHYIPVKRLSDNAIGFYDTDNNEFYQSSTSTQFSGTSKSTPEYIDEITTQTFHINRIYHNGQVYWGGEITQQAIYEVLDEIHATSNPAYILTDYSPIQDTIIEVKYKVNGNYVNNHNERIFSTYPSLWYDAYTVDANYASQGLEVKFPNPPSTSGWFHNLATRDTTSSHILRVAMNECYYDGTLVATGNGAFEPSSSSIIIESVATQSSNDQGYYNLYYFNIYENNTTVRQYVPVRRISDDEIGFYDYVNQDFIAVNGTFAYTSKSTPEYIY